MNLCKVRSRGVIIHEGKLLVVRHSHGASFYALPGGHIDLGEDPLTCIRRELMEELGVEAQVGRLLVVYTFVNNEGVQSVEFFFEILNSEAFLGCEKNDTSHAHEISGIQWIGTETNLEVLPTAFLEVFKSGKLAGSPTLFLNGEGTV